MALSATSKNQLNALLYLLSVRDGALNDLLIKAVVSKVPTQHQAPLAAIITSDGFGSADPHTAGQAAVVSLLADIAAN